MSIWVWKTEHSFTECHTGWGCWQQGLFIELIKFLTLNEKSRFPHYPSGNSHLVMFLSLTFPFLKFCTPCQWFYLKVHNKRY